MRIQYYIFFVVTLVLMSCKTQNLFVAQSNGNMEDLMTADTLYHHIIQPDDKISLSVWNHDDLSVGSVFSIYNSNEAYGKWILVDAEGRINVPRVGTVKLEGLTCPEAADTLTHHLESLIVDPIVVVKVLNREVTVLGEVRTAGTYVLDKEMYSISEVIGKAQGFEKYADLSKVQLIRNDISYIIDMTRKDELQQHNIAVLAGDVINVPSRRGKRLDQKAPTIIPFASAMTAIAVVASILLK